MRKGRNVVLAGCMMAVLLTQLNGLEAKADNQWSEWSTMKPADSNEYQIEKRTMYRYRDKQTVTSSEEEYNGWTRDDSKTKQVWTKWSDWQDEEVTDSDTRIVKTRMQYHYRDKKTTSSTSSTMAGWTQYNTTTTWGGWSAWQDSAVGGTWHIVYTPWMNTPITSYDTGQLCNHGYSYKNDGQKTYNYYNGSKKEHYYYQETQTIPAQYKTQYSYRDATITYYYYQWGDWSSWSTEEATATDSRQVEDKTQYSYREETPVYTYYQWDNWSDYSLKEPKEQEDREIEEQVQYRYCKVAAATTEQATTQQPTTQQATTQQPAPSQPDTVTVGKATIVPVDSQTEEKDVTDSNIKQKGNVKNGNGKGTILVGKNGQYKITNAKKKNVEYISAGTKGSSVEIPSEIKYKMKRYKVTSIAAKAFQNNKKIKHVKVGNNVKKIGNSAFQGCSKLQTVYIGKNVQSIGKHAFYKCKKLNEITIRSEKVKHVGKDAFKKIGKQPTIKIMRKMLGKYNKLFKRKM